MIKINNMMKIIQLIFHPFKIIGENISEFIIWILFTIVAGQFGILANVIVRNYTNDTTISDSILLDSNNGSFYTFSIALVASMLGPIFIRIIDSKVLVFKTLKTFTIIFSIFYLFIAGVIYASVQSKNSNNISFSNLSIDTSQISIYIIALILVTYGYCILRLERRKEQFEYINDPLFNEKDDEKVEDTIETKKEITKDGEIEL